jgi:hypothetical protein
VAQVNSEGITSTIFAARSILRAGTEGQKNEREIIWKKPVFLKSLNFLREDSERPRHSSFKIAGANTNAELHH